MTTTNLDYVKDIRINEHDLESEWINQPSLMMQYNELYAVAVFERDSLKVKLDYTAAKLDSEIRKDYSKFGFESKPTEAAIKSAILFQKQYVRTMKKTLLAAKQANLMAGVRTSMDHRKKALENLVTLKVTGFYSEPRNKTKDLKEKKMTKHHQHNQKVLKGGKRKNKIGRKTSTGL
ncbi:MAG: hypothetical protein DRJ07_13455 [Bacteroidetes bacterium]|nr:MAG: hypothetical protein DRJ07_13455 [Bacteroidota bacterium]